MKSTSQQTVGMLGILGTGMRALAWLLHNQGHTVVGADAQLDTGHIPNALANCAMKTPDEFIEEIPRLTSLIYSDSVPATHPARVAAKIHNIPTKPYHEALGELADTYETVIAITGTHGKSSTTAFLAHILIEAGIDPTVVIGASIPTWEGENARLGNSKVFVTEADEYREHFLALHPNHLIITSVDFDHPDYFTNLQHVEQAYANLILNLRPDGTVTTHSHILPKHSNIPWPDTTVAITTSDWSSISAPLPGAHMQQNAALSMALAEKVFSIPPKKAQDALLSFPGISRRLEHIGSFGKTAVLSDYGHHPAEIAATLQGLSSPDVLVIFEAHMRERLDHFLPQFVDALSHAQEVIIYPPFSPQGREGEQVSAHVESLAQQLQGRHVSAHILTHTDQLDTVLEVKKAKHSTILAFSAGKLDAHLRKILSN